jgi:hypothetical protein
MQTIENYKSAIETSDEHLLNEVLAPRVLAKTASGVKYALTADAGNNWYFLGFECQIENRKLQGIDQLIAYMRPIPVVQRFEELIGQRLRPAA